jgi:hypothetical protein
MPAIARTNYVKTDIVKNPPQMPIPMYSGDISWSLNFEGFPSGSLEYTNIWERDLDQFEANYNHRIGNNSRKIYLKIYNIDFEVESYGYDRKGAVWKNNLINIYTVSVGLKSRWQDLVTQDIKVFKLVPLGSKSVGISTICASVEVPYSGVRFEVAIPSNADKDYTITIDSVVKDYARINGCYVSFNKGVELKSLGSGGQSWQLGSQEVVTDGKNTLAEVVGYRDTELSWGSGDNKNTDATPESTFIQREPVIQILEEVDEDLEKPPEDSLVLRNMTDCHDLQGPKKTRRLTTLVNGNADKEEVWIWSFEYLAEDICLENGLPFSNKPEDYWRVVEYQKTKHKYERIDGLALNIKAKDSDPRYANTDLSGFVYLVVHPDYENFISYSGTGGVFYSNAQYLTESNTTGWRRFRFLQESDQDLVTLFSDDPRYPLAKFKQIPSESAIAYSLTNTRNLYDDTEKNLPFSVEWKVYSELEPRIKEKIDSYGQQISSNGKVGILYPDPNFVEQMSILTESRKVSSFAYTPNPESTPDAPLAPKTTGEESFYITERTIIDSNKYKEKVSEYSTQNSGFSDLAEKVVFKDVSGRLPEATTRKSDWEKRDGLLSTPVVQAKKQRYFMTSDDSILIATGNSKSYPLATTKQEALKAALTDLKIEGMQKDTCQRSVFSFYPNMRDGDRVVTELDRFQNFGDWRIISASFKLSFKGVATKFGLVPVCQSDPISLSLGLVRSRSIDVKQKDAPTGGDAGNGSDPKMIVTGGTTTKLGKVLINSPNRRKY